MRVDNFISKAEPIIKSTEKKTIHIVHILDRSGSMQGGKLTNALFGVNEEVVELQKDNTVNYLFTLVWFDGDVDRQYWQVPINTVTNININSGGSTALYQAIGETLSDIDTTDPVLIKIFTDGDHYNNNWGKYNNPKIVKELIRDCNSKNFTITFVGTQVDTEKCKDLFGLSSGNISVHDNTAEGVTRSFRKSMDATMMYASNVVEGKFTKTLNFYQ